MYNMRDERTFGLCLQSPFNIRIIHEKMRKKKRNVKNMMMKKKIKINIAFMIYFDASLTWPSLKCIKFSFS